MVFLIKLTLLLAILPEYSFPTGDDVIRVTDDAPILEGSNHTMICKLKKKKKKPVLKWLYENNVDAIVHYHNNSCDLNPAFVDQYSYSCDPAENIFNLTIFNVNENYHGKKFVCSGGTNSDCRVLNVAEYAQSLEETEHGKITATSACSSMKRKVSFKWIKIDAANNKEFEFKPKILDESATNCSDECGKNSHMKYTETISVVPGGNGSKYYLKMAVIYGMESIVSEQTQVSYKIEEEAEEFEDEHVNHVFVPVVVVAAAIIAVAVAVLLWRNRVSIRLIRSHFKTSENQQNENEEGRHLINSDGVEKNAPERDLYYISQCITSDWEKLAPYLLRGDSMATVKQIKVDNRSYQQPVFNLLLKWWKQTDDKSLTSLFRLMYKAGSSVTIAWKMIEEKFKFQISEYEACIMVNEEGTVDKDIIPVGEDDRKTLQRIRFYKKSDDNHGKNPFDMKKDCSLALESTNLPKLHLLEEEDDVVDDVIKHMETFYAIIVDDFVPEITVDEIPEAPCKAEEVSLNFNKTSDKAIPSSNLAHLPNTQSSVIPKQNMSATFLTKSYTEVESKGSGSSEDNSL